MRRKLPGRKLPDNFARVNPQLPPDWIGVLSRQLLRHLDSLRSPLARCAKLADGLRSPTKWASLAHQMGFARLRLAARNFRSLRETCARCAKLAVALGGMLLAASPPLLAAEP